MKDETSDFLKKFKNRIEKMGKNGVSGLLLRMNEPINGSFSNNIKYTPSFLNSNNYSNNGNDYINSYNYNNNNQIYNLYQNNNQNYNNSNESNNYFKNKGYFLMDSIPSNNKLLKNNPMIPEIKKSTLFEKKIENSNSRSNILSKSVKLNKINKYNLIKVLNSEKNESEYLNNIDYGYQPYTLKDYKNLPKISLKGGLRSIIGTKEWENAVLKRSRMSNYGENVLKNETGLIYKVHGTPEQIIKRQKEIMRENSKWKRSNTYGKRLLDYQRNVIEDQYFFSEKNPHSTYENQNEILKPERDRDTYIKRLEKMKGLLLN